MTTSRQPLAAGLEAHARWFHDDGGRAADLASVTDPLAIGGVAVAIAVTIAVWLLWRATGRRGLLPGLRDLGADPERRAVLLGLVPVVLGLHMAVPLVVNGVQLSLLAPNLSLAAPGPIRVGSLLAAGVALAEIAVGLALLYGALTRVAALVLGALWLLAAAVFGPFLALEQALVLGLAFFFFAAGRGPYSVDAALSSRFGPDLRLAPRAMPVLRVAAGVALAVPALGEKLWNFPYAEAFLDRYPVNFLAALGLPVSDRLFAALAGTMELTVGLLLVTGAFVRETIVLLWLPINLSLPAFGWRELVGHLPIYGAMAALLVWGDGGRDTAAAFVRGLLQRPTLAPVDRPAEDRV